MAGKSPSDLRPLEKKHAIARKSDYSAQLIQRLQLSERNLRKKLPMALAITIGDSPKDQENYLLKKKTLQILHIRWLLLCGINCTLGNYNMYIECESSGK